MMPRSFSRRVTAPADPSSSKVSKMSPDDHRPFRVNLQLAGIVLHRAVAQDMAAVPEAPIRPVPHDRERPLGGHLPLKLGEYHDELHHRLAGGHRGVELFPQRDDVDIVFGEQRPQIHEVFQAAGDPVELEADDEVDLAGGDVALQPLELRAVLVLGALAGIDVEFQRFDGPAFASFAELNFFLDLVLLGDKAVAFGGLPLRRDPHIAGDSQGLVFAFLFWLTHHVTVLSARLPSMMFPT